MTHKVSSDRLARLVPMLAAPALGAAIVVIAYGANGMTLQSLVRPLSVVVLVGLTLDAAFTVIFGRERGAFWAFVTMSVMVGLYIVGGASLLALTVLQWWRTGHADGYRFAGLVSSGVAISLLGIMIARAFTIGSLESSSGATRPLDITLQRSGPSVHLLLLDGYPRADVLADLGFDNSPFLEGMISRGFDVYPDSRSNYDQTPFSLLSMLSVAHIKDIDALWQQPRPAGIASQQRLVARALLDPPLFEALEGAGYQTRTLSGTVVHVPLGGADVSWSAGTATNFELFLLQRTPLAGILEVFDFATGQQRAHIRETLAEFSRPPDQRTFTFAHVLAPHAPFVFAADGSPVHAPPCYPDTCAIFDAGPENLGWTNLEYTNHLTGQIAYLNELVMAAVDDLVLRDPDSVVIILSDHGAKSDSDAIQHQNLLIARTPGHPGLLGEAPTNVNVIPMVLNAYLGTDIQLQPDTLYRSGESPWLSVEAME